MSGIHIVTVRGEPRYEGSALSCMSWIVREYPGATCEEIRNAGVRVLRVLVMVV